MNTLPTLFFTLTLFSVGVSPLSANIDPIHVEGNEQISPGIYARISAAEEIRRLDITQEISQLYRTLQTTQKKEVGFELLEDDCFALFIRTKNGLPEFIAQIAVKDPSCVNNSTTTG